MASSKSPKSVIIVDVGLQAHHLDSDRRSDSLHNCFLVSIYDDVMSPFLLKTSQHSLLLLKRRLVCRYVVGIGKPIVA
jgi:hypothetical protein